MNWLFALTPGKQLLLFPCIVFCLVGLACFLIYTIRRWRNRYVGMGFELGYFGEGKALRGVYVLSRLLKSPANIAGVQKWDKVLSYAGLPMTFESGAQMRKAVQAVNARLRPGDKVSCTLQRGDKVFEVTLVADVTQGPIPVHLPQELSQPGDREYDHYHQGIAVCLRTGEWIPTRQLSDAHVAELLGT